MSASTVEAPPTPTAVVEQDLVAQVTAADLAAALGWVKHAVPARPPVPVMACVHLSAQVGGLRVQTYDYEVHAVQDVPAVGARGVALVPWRLLRDAIATLPKRAEVHLSVEADRLVVAADGFTWRISTGVLDELPEPPVQTGNLRASMTGEAFAQLLPVTRCASRDETLPVLTGVLFDAKGDGLEVFATDRYRLAHNVIPADLHESGWQALVPARQLAIAAAAFRRDGTVDLWLEPEADGRVTVRAGGRALSWLCVQMDYPKVRQLFPGEPSTVLQIDRRQLITTLRRAAVTTSRNAPARLDVTAPDAHGATAVDLSGGWDDTASGSGRLDALHITGHDAMTVGYNPGFLLDALTSFTSSPIRMAMTEPRKPVVLTAATTSDGDDGLVSHADADPLQLLLMPVRFAD